MLPAAFTPALTADGQDGLRLRIGFPLPHLLAVVFADDEGTSPLPATTALATVPGDDVFAHLEAEMVSESLEAAQAQRRTEVRESVARLLGDVDPSGTGSLDVTVDAGTAQDLVEWLNRMYVTQRTAELADDGLEPTVGESQSAGVFLGLTDDDNDGEDPGDGSGVPMGLPTLVLAALVDDLQEALAALPEPDVT